MLNPVSLTCNKNGDALILDSASSCLLGVDRTMVAKVVTVGTFGLEAYSTSQHHTASQLKMSVNVSDMFVLDDILYIADSMRGEVIIINNVAKIRFLLKAQLFVLAVDDCSSVASVGSDIAVLQNKDGKSIIKIISHDPFPTKKTEANSKTRYSMKLKYKIIAQLSLSSKLDFIFVIDNTSQFFGGVQSDQVVTI
jgi:hypothetical protein